jgi:hypothetical protein
LAGTLEDIMGAWGIGNFDNDDAADWAYELGESRGAQILVAALEQATSEGYLEAPECSVALAAAEIVAALLGNSSPTLPDEVREWVAANDIEVDQKLLSLARAAVKRVKEDSELRELFKDSASFEQWLALEDDLIKRLGAG